MSNRTSTGAGYDDETGEVLHGSAPRRRRRVQTDAERAVVVERKAQRARMLAALDALSPALIASGDPPLRETGPALADVSRARESATLLRLPRLSGTGGPGSALVVTGRDYDGRNGGEATHYVLVHAEFHDGAGFRCRSRGVAIRAAELPAVARALLEYATALERREATRGPT